MKNNTVNMSNVGESNEVQTNVKTKKPVYKRWWFWVIIAVVIVGALTRGGGDKESEAMDNAETAETTETTVDEHTTANEPKATIEQVIRDRVTDNYADTTIDSITINKNLGTVDDTTDFIVTSQADDYIALVYLTWSLKNTGPTAKPVLQLYSDDLAATVGYECEDVAEVVVFWNVTYLGTNVKVAYERNGSGAMIETDSMWPVVFEG